MWQLMNLLFSGVCLLFICFLYIQYSKTTDELIKLNTNSSANSNVVDVSGGDYMVITRNKTSQLETSQTAIQDSKKQAETAENPKDRIYSYDEIKVMMKSAVDVLKNNISIITDPYFYTLHLETIKKEYPFYIIVFECLTAINSNNNVDMDIVLRDLYGDNYINSAELNIEVDIKISSYYVKRETHNLLTDFQRAESLISGN